MTTKAPSTKIADKTAEPIARTIPKNPLFECTSPTLGKAVRAEDAEEAAILFGYRLARQEYGPKGQVDKVKDAGYDQFYVTVGRQTSGGFRGHQETLTINRK